jgi:hypothetical protein
MTTTGDSIDESRMQQILHRHVRRFWLRRLTLALMCLLLTISAITCILVVGEAREREFDVRDLETDLKRLQAEELKWVETELGLQRAIEASEKEASDISRTLTSLRGELIETKQDFAGEQKKIKDNDAAIKQLNDAKIASEREQQKMQKSMEDLAAKLSKAQADQRATAEQKKAIEQKLLSPTLAADQLQQLTDFPPANELRHTTLVLFCHLRDGYSMNEIAQRSLLRFFVAHNYPREGKHNPEQKLCLAQFNGSYKKDQQLFSPTSDLSITELQDEQRFAVWFKQRDAVAASANLDSCAEEIESTFKLYTNNDPSKVKQLLLVVPGSLRPFDPEKWRFVDRVSVFQISLAGQQATDWSAVCRRTGGVLRQFQVSSNDGLGPEEVWQLESSLQVWAERVMCTLPLSGRKGQ